MTKPIEDARAWEELTQVCFGSAEPTSVLYDNDRPRDLILAAGALP